MAMTKEILKNKLKAGYDLDKLVKWIKPLQNALITPQQMTKQEFLEKIKGGFTSTDVYSWVDQLADAPLTAAAPAPTSAAPAAIPAKKKIPAFYKKGDVLMHPVFKHPYVLLEEKDGSWICGLLTSEPSCREILEKTDSRFFQDEYFTKVMFIVAEPIGTFMYAFDNDKQIDEVLIRLKNIFS